MESNYPHNNKRDWIHESSYDRSSKFADYNVKAKKLSEFWRTLPVLLYLSVIVGSIIWVVTLGGAQNDFKGFCVLFANLKYTLIGSIDESYLNMDYGAMVDNNTGQVNQSIIHNNLYVGIKKFVEENTEKHINYSIIASKNGSLVGKSKRQLNTKLVNSSLKINNNFNYLPFLGKNDTHIYPSNNSLHAPINYYHPSYGEYNAIGSHRKLVSIASIDYIYTSWGPVCICNFCIYVGVASLFIAFLCCMFFSLCQIGKHQHSMLERPSNLVLPSLLISFICSLLTVISSWIISKGFHLWCRSVEGGPLKSCREVQNFIWINNEQHILNSKKMGQFYNFLQIAEVASWLTSLFWICCTLLLMVRFFGAMDFYEAPFTPQDTLLDKEIADHYNSLLKNSTGRRCATSETEMDKEIFENIARIFYAKSLNKDIQQGFKPLKIDKLKKGKDLGVGKDDENNDEVQAKSEIFRTPPEYA